MEKSSILTQEHIWDKIQKKELQIRPLLSDEQITETGIDFRLGYDFLVAIQGRGGYINTATIDRENATVTSFFQPTRRQLGETFILHPHQTILAVTLEYVKIPGDTMLMLFLRSSYARLGLSISTIVQPGYCGCISLELTNPNHTPVNLTVGARILQGVLMATTTKADYFSQDRKYLCHVRPEPSAVTQDPDIAILNNLKKI
jgi:dCTP deaminase